MRTAFHSFLLRQKKAGERLRVSAVLIGVITALLNASGIDAVMEKTMLPATQMAADAVEWHMEPVPCGR